MNASILAGLAPVAGAITAIVINSLWEDALLVVCVWLLLRAWPGINAATRYIVWSATLVATVIVPIATTLPFLAPSSSVAMTATAVRVPIPMVTHALTAASSEPRSVRRPPVRSAGDTQPAVQASATPRLPERFRMALPLPVALAILVLWAALAGFAFVRLAIGLFRLEQLKRDALPLPVEYRDAMARWTAANKGSREVRLCVSDDIDVPVAVGLFDSMILIPRSLLERMSENEVDQISLHELAHLRRADDWTNGLQRVAMALFAWNPGVLFVSQQLDLEREVACDDWVLASTGLVRPYAVCLAKMAETSSWPYRPMPAPGVFATRKHISLRIERLLGAGRNAATNLSLGPAAATVAIVGALAFAMQLIAPSVAATMESAKAPNDAMLAAHSTWQPKQIVKYVMIKNDEKVAATSAASRGTESTNVEPTNAPGKTQAAAPVHVHVRGTHVAIPPVDVHIPETTVHVPATDVHVPGRTVSIPNIEINLPGLRALDEKATAVGAAEAGAAAASRASAAMSYAFGGSHVAQSSGVRNCDGCDFAGVNWAGRDLRGANLTGTDLSRANLQGTDFSGGHLNGVDFSAANLQGANFRNARLTGCDFSRANLTGADFTGAVLNGCQFTGAQLTSAQTRPILNTCTGCDFSHANLSGLDLTRLRVNGIDLTRANLSGSNLSDSVFTGVDFSGARLSGAVLTNTTFSGCDMSGVDLTRVDLSRAKFIGTDLETRGSPHP